MSKVKVTNYDLNKQAYQNLPPLDEATLDNLLANVGAWFSSCWGKEYFMVLCRERNDYTLIHVNNYRFDLAVQELKEILESRGEIIDLQYVHGEACYQCWVRERYSEDMDIVLNNINIDWKPQVWMFLLFEAGDFVVETAE